MAMLEIRGVSKAYGRTPVLRGIDLSVEPGELMFLLGPSGCGKSTLLRIVAGLIRQDAGTVVLGGRDVSALPRNPATPRWCSRTTRSGRT